MDEAETSRERKQTQKRQSRIGQLLLP